MNNPLGGSRQNFWRVFFLDILLNFQLDLLVKQYEQSLNELFCNLQDLAHPV